MEVFGVNHGMERLISATLNPSRRYQAGIDRVSKLCDNDKILGRTSRRLQLAIRTCLPDETSNPAMIRACDRCHAPESLVDAPGRQSPFWQKADLVATSEGAT